MTRVLLTGSTGLLGGAFLSLWGKEGSDYSVRCVGRDDIDLSLSRRIRHELEKIWNDAPFDVLVNPAAISGLEECRDDPNLAQSVNVKAPGEMARFCAERGVKMVHFSTDYVFRGDQEGLKCEEDTPDPINVYGKTKYQGECLVLANSQKSIVARVSWLFGVGRMVHVDSVLEKSLAGEKQVYIEDKFSVPTYINDIVDWVSLLLEKDAAGIYHLCNGGEPESWFSVAQKIASLANQMGEDIDLKLIQGMPISKANFFREPRPVYTAMSSQKLVRKGIATPRDWLDAAREYVELR